MAQICSKCSRANPADAVYCFYDGLVLGGHSQSGGPVAVGAQAFSSPFVFPNGKVCRSFNELALTCQEDWKGARDLLTQGYLETFLGGLGRIDLVMAAKEASKFPDHDRGLDQFLSKLPSDALESPKLALETQEINLGVLPVGSDGRQFDLRLENQGMRLLYGSVTCTDGLWLSFGDAPGAAEKHFQFGHDLALPVRVVGDRLRAGNKPLEAHLAIDSNGGTATVTVRAEVPIQAFPDGALAGAKSPRQVAEKAKAHAKEAAAQFESGAVSSWYKSNGWTYPVQGPAGSGLGAVQQFFEALGLTPAPKVEINVKSVALSANPGENVRYVLEVRTEEKKPIYAHGVSNQPWLEVGRGKPNGRVVTIPLSIPSAPNKPGQTLTASVTVHSNGNQRFVVPVTLQVTGSNAFNFDEPEAVSVVAEPEVVEAVEAVAAARPSPAATAPVRPISSPQGQPAAPVADRATYRPPEASKPVWVHLIPAALLGLALLIVVATDFLVRGSPTVTHPDTAPGITGDPESWKFTNLRDPDPRLGLRFSNEKRFGLYLIGVKDKSGQNKKLTFDDQGNTNNTVVKIDEHEFFYGGRTQEGNKIVSSKDLPKGRYGSISVMDFPVMKVRVKQHVEIVPGQSGLLDTCLVWYHVENYGVSPTPVGLRFMLDTYIGSNDGVPFSAPGVKNLITDMREFKTDDIPPYLQVVENDDPNDPTVTAVRLGLKNIRLPGLERLEEPDDVRITHLPGGSSGAPFWKWDVPMDSISDPPPDSCVAVYWSYGNLKPKVTRDMAFTYGLSQLDIATGGNGALALSTPDAVPPDSDFIVMADVYNAKAGDKVKLSPLPKGLALVGGEDAEKTVDEDGKRVKVEWKVHAGPAGVYPIEATSRGAKTKPHDVVVKSSSIFG